MRAELAGAHGSTVWTSGWRTGAAAARATASAACASAPSAGSTAGSATPSTGAADENGTKPLLRGPKKDEVRNMKCFLLGGCAADLCAAGAILDKARRLRGFHSVRKTTRVSWREATRGFGHEPCCELAVR
jgi:hypothetical protein